MREQGAAQAQGRNIVKSNLAPKRNPQQTAERARQHITQLRTELAAMDYVCSGTLLERMKTCGSPACRCAQDPAARHGPYYEWGHMKAGKLVHQLAHRRTGGPAATGDRQLPQAQEALASLGG